MTSTNAFASTHAGSTGTISATVLAAVERELAWSEWESRLAEHPTTDLGVDAATLIAEERAHRASETG